MRALRILENTDSRYFLQGRSTFSVLCRRFKHVLFFFMQQGVKRVLIIRCFTKLFTQTYYLKLNVTRKVRYNSSSRIRLYYRWFIPFIPSQVTS